MATLRIKNYAVGQGGMALIRLENGSQKYNILYDCGADSGEGSSLTARVSDLVIDLAGSAIDFLILSHLHDDHVNGLVELAAALGKDRVRSVMMPAFNVSRLVIAAVEAYGHNPRTSGPTNSRLQRLATPVTTVRSALGGTPTIVMVRGVDPPDDDDTPSIPDQVDLDEPEGDLGEWELGRELGELRIRAPRLGETERDERGGVLTVDAPDAVISISSPNQVLIDLKPFCIHPELESSCGKEFMKDAGVAKSDSQGQIANKLVSYLSRRGAARDLARRLQDVFPDGLGHRLGVGRTLLKLDLNRGGIAVLLWVHPLLRREETWVGITSRLARVLFQSPWKCHDENVLGTSPVLTEFQSEEPLWPFMRDHHLERLRDQTRIYETGELLYIRSVFHEHMHSRSSTETEYSTIHLLRAPDNTSHQQMEPIAFLWLGDCQLNPKRYADALGRFYSAKRLNRVRVAQLPHHGSRRNCNPAALPAGLAPTFWHVSYAEENRHRHPSGSLIAALGKSAHIVPLTDQSTCNFEVTLSS